MQWEFDHHNRHLDHAPGNPLLLERYLREGEHQQQDFKFRIDSSVKIARTLSAFANTEGGRLLIGVKDNGKVTGIDPEEEYFMIEGAAEVYCQPPIPFSCQVFNYEEKLVLEVRVPASAQRPHSVKEVEGRKVAYLRRADENFAANRVLLRYLRDKSPASTGKNLVAYGPAERGLFEYLSEHEHISISKFARQAKLPLPKAERIMASFLKWGVVDWLPSDQGLRFRLRED